MRTFWLGCVLSVWIFFGGVDAAFAAEDFFSIDGSVLFTKAMDIKVLLLNEAEFEDLAHASYVVTVTPDEAARAKGEAAFRMEDVPAGSYVLLAFQDENGNQKLDSRFFRFSEPWGTFRPQRPGMGFLLEFEDLVFDLTQNIDGITIRLNK